MDFTVNTNEQHSATKEPYISKSKNQNEEYVCGKNYVFSNTIEKKIAEKPVLEQSYTLH